jgi:hypothetical protein
MILAFQTATTRRETSLTEVVYRQVTALSMVASKSVSRPAVVVQPGKGAFCGPASRQQHKSHGRPPPRRRVVIKTAAGSSGATVCLIRTTGMC